MEGIATLILSAIVSIIVAYATAKTASYSRDVVGERKDWRDKVRTLTVEASLLMQRDETRSPRFLAIISEFRLRLNPDDRNDMQILKTLEDSMLISDDLLRMKFLAQVARLLKHDWERAKVEARLISFPYPNEDEIRRLRSNDYMK
ncbi:hypothetical protein U879_01850 [Defluviimonas sp. 20V17]|uniref:Uncharacterized protein n=2 Tax=Allgaiera indica TaxID=765699 RepID=A0AAN4UTM3_9RHOB|nr:hypothetical protein [Allgaiera indica]KDB05383.1 hypothetical protein U879_01850 [Defluviimonas sp. 20V17]GHE04183.1 hypothetical protein GCM10008024_30360 [Allgaiera indica]